MNDNAKKLVEALRSGDYKQGREALRSDETHFCCLGVACDISGLSDWTFENGKYVYLDESIVLPTAVEAWLGFKSPTGDYSVIGSLSSDNDSGLSFEEIADTIERKPELFE